MYCLISDVRLPGVHVHMDLLVIAVLREQIVYVFLKHILYM